ncbi:MAG: DUF1836 domain-containing protein [Oscillospiraceae bacterium]|nr:DUF1836 domain-containing protein [Oscillospiraceae bacterium]
MAKYDFAGYRCPRWEELPDLGLYMDQVLLVVEQALRQLFPDDAQVLTSTMVNNYVKQKVLSPSEKKKYAREHLAQLILITVLKRVLSVAEIKFVLDRMKEGMEADRGYDLFCTQLECRLQGKAGEKNCDPVLAAAVDAVAGKLLFEAECAAVRGE